MDTKPEFTLPYVFKSYDWDWRSDHKWGFIKDLITNQKVFFHHSCLAVELNEKAKGYCCYAYKLGVSPTTGKVCCRKITKLDDATIKEFLASYDNYSEEYKKFIDSDFRNYEEYITAYSLENVAIAANKTSDHIIDYLRTISKGILYTCFEVTLSQGIVFRRDPDDRWYSQKFYGSINHTSSNFNLYQTNDHYLSKLIGSKEKDTGGCVIKEEIPRVLKECYETWKEEILNEYDISKHIDSLIEDAIDVEKSKHSSYLKKCSLHCCSIAAYDYLENYIMHYREELLKHREEIANASTLSSYGIVYHGLVYCLNSDKQSVTLQTTTGALEKCTHYLKPEADNEMVEFRIPEYVAADDNQYPVTAIARGVFDSMNELRTIYIPRYVKDIKWSFWECIKLERIVVDPNNEYFCDIDGVLFSFDKQTLIAYPQNRNTEYVVPSGVKRIHNLAFKNNTKIAKLYIPDTLTSIGMNAFYRCDNLEELHGHMFHEIKVEGFFGNIGKVDPLVVFEVGDTSSNRTLRSLIRRIGDTQFEVYP